MMDLGVYINQPASDDMDTTYALSRFSTSVILVLLNQIISGNFISGDDTSKISLNSESGQHFQMGYMYQGNVFGVAI